MTKIRYRAYVGGNEITVVGNVDEPTAAEQIADVRAELSGRPIGTTGEVVREVIGHRRGEGPRHLREYVLRAQTHRRYVVDAEGVVRRTDR